MEYRLTFLVSLLSVFWFSVPIKAFTASYCSSQNTGSTDKFFWTWQSNGKCTDHCNSLGTYAYAVIQYTDCWCTNYAPAQQVDVSDCMEGCPGFGDKENCGAQDKGLYVYIEMAGTPSGTQGGSQPSSTSNPSSKPDNNGQSSTTWSIVTESGVVITKTLLVGSTSAPNKTDNQNKGSNTGAIVGGVVGGVLFLLAIIGGVFFLLWRRKKQRQQLEDGTMSSSGGITRNVSTLSKSGLLGTTTEKEPYPPQLNTHGSQHGSRHDAESISPISASDRRYSQPVMIDSRLDPRAVLTFHGANVSRDSLASIDDSRDYGRQLNVRNPDP